MALRDDIRNAMIAAGFDPDDDQNATSPKYNARLFEAISGVVKAEMAGSVDWSTLTEYRTPGTYSVAVPENCDKMIVLLATGAGGGGYGGGGDAYWLTTKTGTMFPDNGGNGAWAINAVVGLNGKTSLSITVGRGGSAGSSGGATSVAGLFSLGGGSSYKSYGGSCTGIKGFDGALGDGGHTARPSVQDHSSVNNNVGPRLSPSIFGAASRTSWTPAFGQGGGADGGGNGYLCFAFIRKA